MSSAYLLRSLERILLDDTLQNPAAKAIREVLQTMIADEICTAQQFVAILDLDRQREWPVLREELAERIVPMVTSNRRLARDFKPWMNCPGYKEKLSEIADRRVWLSSNAALSALMHRVDELLERQ